ncbi:MAG: hypothetical protein F4117_07925 [Acidimicrobiales bacterium]|nr:hypothetical protein [Acidimicrobiales bacterium]MYB81384.1 hypothetical protein [Acidimicrobiales bacterium]MYI12477.1 hypothetical protein [Acidimicrobiales bacterium]
MRSLGLLNADDWTQRVLGVARYQAPSGARSPYKPLLLLWLIGRVTNGSGSSVTFREAEEPLANLLTPHAIASTTPQPAVPFAALASDPELWSVHLASGADFGSFPWPSRRNARFLRAESATGQLAPRFFAALGDRRLRDRVVNELLFSEFPKALHRHILTEVGLNHHVLLHHPADDPEFRRRVIRAYDMRCAMCGFGMAIGKQSLTIGLEAAHIKMPSKGGPYEVDNGLLLCDGHRTMFDWGALGIDSERRICVSEAIVAATPVQGDALSALRGRPIRCSHRTENRPSREYTEWHRANIFKH